MLDGQDCRLTRDFGLIIWRDCPKGADPSSVLARGRMGPELADMTDQSTALNPRPGEDRRRHHQRTSSGGHARGGAQDVFNAGNKQPGGFRMVGSDLRLHFILKGVQLPDGRGIVSTIKGGHRRVQRG